MEKRLNHPNSPFRLLFFIGAAIFFVELGIMFAFQYFLPISSPLENFIDAFFLLLIIYPVLYIFIFKPLVKQNKEKTEFVSFASHQLRSPLTSINWYTEMLLKGDTGEINSNQKKYLNEIYKGNKRMTELINALLDVSRLELGTIILESKPVQFQNEAESVFLELESQILSQKIVVEKKYDPSLPVIFTDPKSVRMIFQNLLNNAVKYVEVGGKVGLEISKQETDVLIKVWNDGPQLSEESRHKMFFKFFRDDFAKQKDPDGSGFGLYIVKTVVENLGGKIWFESPIEKEEGRGVAFYVTLPLVGKKEKIN